MVSAHFSTATLNNVVGSDAATTRAFVNANLRPADLDGSPLPADRLAALEAQLASLTRTGEILRVEIRRPDGTVLAASEPGAAGARAGAEPAFQAAASGAAQAAIVPVADAAAAPGATPFAVDTLIREDLPIETGDAVRGVVVMWRDAGPILARLADVRRDVVLVTLSAALIAAALLFLIFRAAQARSPARRPSSSSRPGATRSPDRSTTARSSPTSRTRSSAPAPPACRSASRSSISTTSGCSTTSTAMTPATRHCSRSHEQLEAKPAGQRRRRALRPGRVPARRAGRERRRRWSRRSSGSGRPSPTSASSSRRPSGCRSRSAPGCATYPGARRVGDAPPGGRRQRRSRRRRRAAATLSGSPGSSDAGVDVARRVRHPPGPRPRRRHEGSLHEAPLRGRRAVRRLPRQPHRA